MSDSRDMLELKTWLQMQVQSPVFEADCLKDGCLQFLNRIEQLGRVAQLTQPETDSSYIAKFSYRIIKGLQATIKESIKNLKAVENELSDMFVTKFPKFSRKLGNLTEEERQVYLIDTDTEEREVRRKKTSTAANNCHVDPANSDDGHGSEDSAKTSFIDLNANVAKKIKKEKGAQNSKKKTDKRSRIISDSDSESENGSHASHNRSVHSNSTEKTIETVSGSAPASQEDLFPPDPIPDFEDNDDEAPGSPAETVLLDRSGSGGQRKEKERQAESSKERKRISNKKEPNTRKETEEMDKTTNANASSNGSFSDSDTETVFNPMSTSFSTCFSTEPLPTSTARLSLSRNRPPPPHQEKSKDSIHTDKDKTKRSPEKSKKTTNTATAAATSATDDSPNLTTPTRAKKGPTTKRKLEFNSLHVEEIALDSDDEQVFNTPRSRKIGDKDKTAVLNTLDSSDVDDGGTTADASNSSDADANKKEENSSPKRKKFRKSISRRSCSLDLNNCDQLKMKTSVAIDPLDPLIIDELNIKKKIQLGPSPSQAEAAPRSDLIALEKAIQGLTSFDPLKKDQERKRQISKPKPKSKITAAESSSQVKDNQMGEGVFTSSDEDSDATVALSSPMAEQGLKGKVLPQPQTEEESGMSTTENNENEELQSDLNYTGSDGDDKMARKAVLSQGSPGQKRSLKSMNSGSQQRAKGHYITPTPQIKKTTDESSDTDDDFSITTTRRKPLKPKSQNTSLRPVSAVKKEVSLQPDSDSDFKDVPTPKPSQSKKSPTLFKNEPNSDSEELLSLSDKEKSGGCSDEDFVHKTKGKKNKRVINSSSDEVNARKPKKKTRKTLKATSSSSSSSSDSDIQIIDEKNGSDTDIEEILSVEPAPAVVDLESPVKQKKIRAVMDERELQKSTRVAAKEEEERKKRLAEKQRAFNDLFETPEFVGVQSLVLDFDARTKAPLISVDKELANKLKPHQCDGVQFMWDSCFESVETKGSGGGCILAHCMGLGKTLQTITFLHTVMTHDRLGVKRSLVICPLNTVGNWHSEFKQWLKDVQKKITIHKLYESGRGRNKTEGLEAWKRAGGVGIIHYDSFRLLSNAVYPPPPKKTRGGALAPQPKKPPKPKYSERELKIIDNILLNPGPDIVVCDEGHLLKNAASKLTHAVGNFKTKRRIVLTGTPLQNNLMEYHTMMTFVKPHLLGSRKEFANQFANPIKQGQHKDSMEGEVKHMKRRAHVLHKLLEGCVQRMDYTVLTPFLPPKFEYAISVNLTPIQKEMYQYYLETFCADAEDGNFKATRLFADHSYLYKVWTHPKTCGYRTKANGGGGTGEDSDSAGSLRDFINDDEEELDSDCIISDNETSLLPGPSKRTAKGKKGKGRAGDLDETMMPRIPRDWYKHFFPDPSELNKIEISGKMIVLMEILKMCESIGDKVLIFSQYISSLNLIEEFLEVIDEKTRKANLSTSFGSVSSFPMIPDSTAHHGRWRRGIEYFRIDGSTKAEDRKSLCDRFNSKAASKAKLFLISTKAGGLGINLVGANRVVIFDASWNPSQDLQSIFRVYRFGQSKPCYIYRLLARGTMEEKMYNRQVVKLSLSSRVVDEHQIERHFQYNETKEFYTFEPNDTKERPVPVVPKDRLFADLLTDQKDWIFSYLEHDSLLVNKIEEMLSEDERTAAWEEYNNGGDKNIGARGGGGPGPSNPFGGINENDPWIAKHREMIRNSHPRLSEAQILQMTMEASGEIKQMMVEWEYLRNPLISAIQKFAIQARFDQLMEKLNYKFGRGTVEWDGVLTQYKRPSLPVKTTSNLVASAVQRMNLQTAAGSLAQGQGPSGSGMRK